MSWFVLRTEAGVETRISTSIEKMGEGYRSFTPTREVTVVSRGRKTVRQYPLWATYVLADWLDDGGYSWHKVMNIKGVLGVIGGEFPTPVQDWEVSEFLEEMKLAGTVRSLDDLLARIRRGYDRGDTVRIEGGPFDGQSGTCNWFDKSGVSVKIAFLGRETNIYVDLNWAKVIGLSRGEPGFGRKRSPNKRRSTAGRPRLITRVVISA